MSKKYKVHQLIKLGNNPIFAGTYDEAELPESIKNNPKLCTLIDGNSPPTANYAASITTQNITLGTKEPLQKQESFKPKPPVEIDPEKDKTTLVVFDVNEATIEELSSLDGITVQTAQEVVTQREKTKFVDLADLDKRVPLKGNRKWSNFSDRLKF